MAGFSGAFRTSVGRDDFLRSAEDEAYTQSIIARLMGTDWFSRNDNVRLGGLRTASALGGLPDRDSLNLGDVIRNEDIRRINAVVQIANGQVTPNMRNAEIHPKLSTSDGRFPREFDIPRRVDDFLTMENNSIDRILIAYGLPRDTSSFRRPTPLLQNRDFLGFNLEAAREAKLLTLFEYLGLDLCSERRLGGGMGRFSGGLACGNRGIGL